ncbi:MAG: ABC transporter substrate-binding protein [Candidatus Paceibacterota bacterium]
MERSIHRRDAFSQHNIEPIGTGPYHVKTITRDRSGLISEYVLAAAPNATPVNIQEIRVRFFTNEETLLEALKTGAINSTAGLNEHLAEVASLSGYTVEESPLPRVFAIYLNQNKSDLLRDQSVRAALNVALDREAMITQVLNGYGTPAHGPVPEAFFSASSSSLKTATDTLAVAAQTLSEGGWEQTEEGTWQHIIDEATTTLAITIRTANSPLFEATARFIEESWSELGVVVNVELYEQSDLVQAVIRPRDYQALLFGADIGRSLDLYPFWHSAEREDPGLNVALYTNITTDKLLQDIRVTQDAETRDELLQQFEQEVTAEAPAIFLFNPSFVYVMKSGITSPPLTRMSRSSERFSSIADWYMDESRVWSIFAD